MRRKYVVVLSAVLSVCSVAGVAESRRRVRPITPTAPQQPPTSVHIAEELGDIMWGWNKDQVVEYFRRTIGLRYQPQLRGLGQIEQDRLLQNRDREIQTIQNSFVQFNGQLAQRRWDSSFIGEEYTQNNRESMLVVEDRQTGNREFFFFIQDKLWKRFQARALPPGANIDFSTFVAGLEALFGPGLRSMRPDAPDQLLTISWQDTGTRLRVLDHSAFFNSYCLVYEDRNTLARLAELRPNASVRRPTVNVATGPRDFDPHQGMVAEDPNQDIVDRITAQMRRGNPDAGSGSFLLRAGDDAGVIAPVVRDR